MARIVSGSSVPTPSVDPTRRYFEARSIHILEEVGALNTQEADVARRLDGTLDNQPRDGAADLYEIQKAEQNPASIALFPEERSVLQKLVQSQEAPDVQPPVAPSLPAMTSLAQLVVPHLNAGNALDLAAPVPVSKLYDLSTLARRIQLMQNSDSRAETITLADLDAAQASPGGFTRDDVASFPRLRERIEGILRRVPSPMTAQVEVPMPGTTVSELPFQGSSQFRVTTQINIADKVITRGLPGEYSTELQSFSVERSQRLDVVISGGTRAVLLPLSGTGGELLLDAGMHDLTGLTGTYRVELWQHGQRTESADVILPSIAPHESVELRPFQSVPMIADGYPLVRYGTVDGPGVFAVPGSEVQGPPTQTLPQWRWSYPMLPAGTYDIPGGNAQLRVWEGGLLSIVRDGKEKFLHMSGGKQFTYAQNPQAMGPSDVEVVPAGGLDGNLRIYLDTMAGGGAQVTLKNRVS
jgi:hypothetical protein